MHPPAQEDLDALIRGIEEDERWLLSCKWQKIKEEYVDPETGEKYPLREAADKQGDRLIKNLGWFPIIILTTHPKTKLPKPEQFQYYCHPTSHRVFLWVQAIAIARFQDNDDSQQSSIITRIAEDVLKDIPKKPYMGIQWDMWLDNYEAPIGTPGNAIYKVVKVVDSYKDL